MQVYWNEVKTVGFLLRVNDELIPGTREQTQIVHLYISAVPKYFDKTTAHDHQNRM